MKILVLGCAGILGTALRGRLSGHSLFCRDLCDYDLRDTEAFEDDLCATRPDAVINCAAFTRVDDAEDCPEQVMEINGEVPGRLARACGRAGAVMVQMGTDYIFDGSSSRPWREDDPPNPLSVYGQSKLLGEARVQEELPGRHLIIRTSWLFGAGGRNFPLAMVERLKKGEREFRVVSDQFGRPTYSVDLAAAIGACLEKGLTGIYHACNAGAMSWHEFAGLLFRRLGVTHDFTLAPVSSDEWVCKARRPRYSVLDTAKLEAAGIVLPGADDALCRYLDSLGFLVAR